ncbi:Latent-Transforming Growth Factor Beta-Binding Protein 2 [Manis pentadactyla]|nr:Latent-Transforming Growth Factor Beta-Binding Protein 2 [Manis pentadactyla]
MKIIFGYFILIDSLLDIRKSKRSKFPIGVKGKVIKGKHSTLYLTGHAARGSVPPAFAIPAPESRDGRARDLPAVGRRVRGGAAAAPAVRSLRTGVEGRRGRSEPGG